MFRSSVNRIVTLFTAVTVFATNIEAVEVSVAHIRDAWNKNSSTATTILVEHDLIIEFIAPTDVVLGEFGGRPIVGDVKVVNVLHRDGRGYFRVADDWDRMYDPFETAVGAEFPEYGSGDKQLSDLPYDRLLAIARTELAKIESEEEFATVTVFDGEKAWRRADEVFTTPSKSFTAWTVLHPSGSGSPVLPKSILLWLGLATPNALLPNDAASRRKDFMVEFLRLPDVTIVPTSETVNGVESIAVEAGDQKIWLAPKMNFMIVRRIWKWSDGAPAFAVDASEFVELENGLWLPNMVKSTQYGAAGIGSGEWAGKPVYSRTHRLTNVEVDLPDHLALLRASPEPGEMVVDHTLGALDESGNAVPLEPLVPGQIPSVSYTVPADKGSLDSAIQAAQRKAASRPAPPASLASISSPARLVVWAFACFLGILGTLAAVNSFRR
jgi:hypothetical protein